MSYHEWSTTISTNYLLEIIILDDKQPADVGAVVEPPEVTGGEDPPSTEAPDTTETQGKSSL